jgi:hypothetical protein
VIVEPCSTGGQSQRRGQSGGAGIPGVSEIDHRRLARRVGLVLTVWAVMTGLLILVGEGAQVNGPADHRFSRKPSHSRAQPADEDRDLDGLLDRNVGCGGA